MRPNALAIPLLAAAAGFALITIALGLLRMVIAGPATPPTPALATDPLRPDPAGPVLAIQDNPAVHTTP